MIAVAVFQAIVPRRRRDQRGSLFGSGLKCCRAPPGGTAVFGFMPVVPMTIISALLMVVVSRITSKPSATTVQRYFQSNALS